MSLPLLLEIGTEEIPDWMIPGALENLRLLFEKLEIAHDSVTLDATPRRLVLRADGLPERQPDSEEKVHGPGQIRARRRRSPDLRARMGIKPEDLGTETTAKGEYYVFIKKVTGRAIKDILADALPGLILQIYFPKTMYWTGKGGPRFIRPIRWIVALLGEEIVPFELAGVPLGSADRGTSPAGRARNCHHHARLRAAAARPFRDPLRRTAAPEDHWRDWPGVRVKAGSGAARSRWSI